MSFSFWPFLWFGLPGQPLIQENFCCNEFRTVTAYHSFPKLKWSCLAICAPLDARRNRTLATLARRSPQQLGSHPASKIALEGWAAMQFPSVQCNSLQCNNILQPHLRGVLRILANHSAVPLPCTAQLGEPESAFLVIAGAKSASVSSASLFPFISPDSTSFFFFLSLSLSQNQCLCLSSLHVLSVSLCADLCVIVLFVFTSMSTSIST